MAALSRLLVVTAICFSFSSNLVSSHPNEHFEKVAVYEEMVARGLGALEQRAQYDKCSNSAEAIAREERAVARRAATLQRLREERGLVDEPFIHRRNLAQFEAFDQISHNNTGKTSSITPEATLFGANVSYTLTPDNVVGPYYVLGEQIRSNVKEDQPGIPMHLELSFVDVTTCKAVQPLVVDIWSCNADGVYSGVSAAGEGGLSTTFLRGFQQTDAEGVVKFDTIFPGHYAGRATHLHISTHTGATINADGTYSGGNVSHISQLFFDTALINAVEATTPYNTNTITRTSNDADLFSGYAASSAYDPFPEYVRLGNSLSSGIFVWHTLGIKPANNWTYYGINAAYQDSTGGHDNPNFQFDESVTPPPDHG